MSYPNPSNGLGGRGGFGFDGGLRGRGGPALDGGFRGRGIAGMGARSRLPGNDGGFRGRGRGGLYGGFRGRGGGGPGLLRGMAITGKEDERQLEVESARYQSTNHRELMSKDIEVTTNQMRIDLSNAFYYAYDTAFSYAEIQVGFQLEAQEYAFKRIFKGAGVEDRLKDVVLTGTNAFSPFPLAKELLNVPFIYSFMDKEDNKHVKREMKITILGGRRVKVTLPELRAELNCIISQAVSLVYPTREVLRYTDSSTAKEHSSGVVTRDGVKVKVMQVKLEDGPVDVIQLDFSYGVSSALSLMNTMEEMGPNANNICGTRVVTSHAGAKDLMMVVTSTTELKASDKVGLPKDPELTFVDYFKSRYNVDLKPDGPIVKCKDPRRSTRSLPFPAEVLRSLELTPAQFNSLSDICSIYPDERRTKVLASYNRIRNSEAVTAFLDQYGIKLMGDTLLTVTGRVLPVPKIYVPNGNGFTWLDPLNPKYTRQAGFMEGVATVSHAQSRATYKVDHFLMDNFFKGTRIVEFLKKYHVAIPDPELTDFRNEHGNDKTVCMVKLENTNEDVYSRFKANFALRKTVSQMIVKEPIKVIPQMIAQQVAAKIGQMNWVVDPTEIAPKTVGSKPLVIIGLHVSLALETVGKGRTTVKTRNLLVTCVAFLVEGKRWQPYCNHRRVQGNIVQTDEENKQVSTGTRVTPSEVANEQFDAFLREIVTVFDLKNKKEGTTLLYRTCPGEGEVVVAKGLAPMIKAALPTWEYAVLSAQVHTGTRLLWKFSASPKFVNAPRGFASPMGIDAVYNDSVHTFILSGSFCELGNSANTCYVVLHHTAKVDKAELEKFTYALCFLYPNKADALPLPLPMKCASEYAKKFLSFQHLTELPPEMRRSMHYL